MQILSPSELNAKHRAESDELTEKQAAETLATIKEIGSRLADEWPDDRAVDVSSLIAGLLSGKVDLSEKEEEAEKVEDCGACETVNSTEGLTVESEFSGNGASVVLLSIDGAKDRYVINTEGISTEDCGVMTKSQASAVFASAVTYIMVVNS